MTRVVRVFPALILVLFCGLGGAAPLAGEEAGARGVFSANDFPAVEGGAAILTLPSAGRYSIAAKSSAGARIELIDMIAGPLDAAGAAGLRDGRLDALLDKGAYKIRVDKARGASGRVRLAAQPFAELNAKRPDLTLERPQSAELGDLQQRSYGVEIGPEGRVSIEALGRALADLRLWRETGELVDLSPEKRSVETRPGRAMNRLRLEGAAAPGRYVVTAYGGEPLVWPEGDKGRPFVLRIATATPLDAGLFEGVIGPFGSARFIAPASYNVFRLDLPQPAPARLEASRGRSAPAVATITKASRDAFALAAPDGDEKEPAQIEISGYEGQSFSLRAARRAQHFSFEGSGLYLIGVDLAGEGGDEVPATALFARIDRDGKAQALASDTPRIGNGRAWRAKFNLRGLTSLLFEMIDSGPVAVEVAGVTLRATIEPALGALAPRAAGETPKRYDLAPGFYKLALEPAPGAGGVADVTLGAPGLSAPEPERAPSRTSISFGQQQLERTGSYLILGNVAPQMLFGPRIAALPADLSKAPLPLWQGANETLAIPLRVLKGGKIVARDSRGADVPFALGPETTQDGASVATAKILPNGRDRALGFSFTPEPAAAAPARGEKAETGEAADAKTAKPPRARAPLNATGEHPLFFDLGKDETQELRLDLAQPGLYRAETLGRLKTAIRLGARIAANLGAGEDNGPGHNGLVASFLRAGAYRAAVTAKDSSGRVGFAIVRAALVETPPLKAGGAARARLAPGVGAAIPFQIEEDGRYVLDLLGVGRTFNARLEDSEGWPLTAPGPAKELARDFAKGAYRLVVTPEDVEARLVVRLRAVKPAKELSGHGPHALPFEEPQKLQWREPQAQGAPRDPDRWLFSLAGDAEIALAVSEGMIAEVLRGDESLGKFTAGRDFKKRLGAGDYRVEARALGPDDRLDYTISLSSKELQPGRPRFVELPAKLDFAIAKDRVVDIASFGDKEILTTLKDRDDAVIEQATGGDQDWNVALSRRLPAGAYTLELAPLGPRPEPVEAQSDDQGGDQSGGADKRSGVEVLLSLPGETDDGMLNSEGARTLSGRGAHALAAPKAPPGTLTLVSARSAREMALSVERRGADGIWRAAGLRRGRAPFIAWPADETEAFRVLAWPVGGGDAGIDIGARVIERRGQNGPKIGLEPVDGLPALICVAVASLANATTVDIAAPSPGLAVGSSPGQMLREARDGVFAPQSDRLWFVAPGDCRGGVAMTSVAWRDETITLDLAAGEKALLPPLPTPSGKARLWLARSETGFVGLDAGLGMALAADATLALAGDKPLRLWNAGGAGPLRVALQALDVDLDRAVRAGAPYRATLPPLAAQPVIPPTGDAPLTFELPPNTAVFAVRPQTQALALYAGAASLSATYSGARQNDLQLLFVNLSQAPTPVAFAETEGRGEQLTKDHMLKRFFGVGGEIVLPIEAAKGDVLYGLGGRARFVSQDGRVSRTAHWDRAQSDDAGLAIEGRGFVIFDHPPGLSALWLEGRGRGPWPVAAAKPVTPPQRVNLSGEAEEFSLSLGAPAELSLRGGAPAIVAVTQAGKRELAAFPEGVELRRYLAAGEAMIDVYAPHAGALGGALEIAIEPVIAAHEGLNDPVTLGPGKTALFGFETKSESDIGLGLRADPDLAAMRLLSADGKVIGEGLAQMRRLPAGRYVVEARAPQDAPLSVVRLAVLGLAPPPASPPDDVVTQMLEKAGLKKSKTR